MNNLPLERLICAGLHVAEAEFMFEDTRYFVKDVSKAKAKMQVSSSTDTCRHSSH